MNLPERLKRLVLKAQVLTDTVVYDAADTHRKVAL